MLKSEMLFRTFMVVAVATLILIAGSALTGCSKSEVSFNTLEEAKQTARENAMFNAQRYRQENVLYRGWDIIGRGDSSQMPNCPQGDGWATMEFVSPTRQTIVKVKCSTVSGATGCLEDSDFKTKPFASEDGHCQEVTKVPFPLPKIAK
jgi:hypothetical protein